MQPDSAPELEPVEPQDPRRKVPERIGGYRVLEVLGQGASGIVYRVHDDTLDRPMALKLLAGLLDEEARARFLVEARAAGRIIHPNVVQVFGVGSHDGRTFITQEFVDGHPLSRLLDARGRLSAAAVIDVGVQAARALGRAAQAGVLHRDVKPHNFLVTDEGTVKLADFGLAKLLHSPSVLTDTGTTLGTPHYMSPEQGRAGELDHRSDQYALGATLYHLLSGRPPFDADNALALLLKHLQEPLIPLRERAPDCPPALAAVVERMMEKDRDRRFADFEEVAAALEGIDLAEASSLAQVAQAEERRVEPVVPEEGPPPAPATPPAVELGRAGWVSKAAPVAVGLLAALVVLVALLGSEPRAPRGEGARVEAERPDPRAGVVPGGVSGGEARWPNGQGSGTPPAPWPEGQGGAAQGGPAFPEGQGGAAPGGSARPEGQGGAPAESAAGLMIPAVGGVPAAGGEVASGAAVALPPSEPENAVPREPEAGRGWSAALSKSPASAERAVRALGRQRDHSSTLQLVRVMETHPSLRVRMAAAEVLGTLGDMRALEPLRRAAESGPAKLRPVAARAAKSLFAVEGE